MSDWILNIFHILSSWCFDQSSLVDVLAFCFALNTMLSFSKIRHRLLAYFQKNLRDVLEENRAAFADCEMQFKNSPKTVGDEMRKCANFGICFSEVEDLIEQYKNTFNVISYVFNYIFFICAAISGVLIVFSKIPLLTCHHKYVILLFIPIIAFYLIAFILRIKIRINAKRYRVELKKCTDEMNNITSAMAKINKYMSSN